MARVSVHDQASGVVRDAAIYLQMANADDRTKVCRRIFPASSMAAADRSPARTAGSEMACLRIDLPMDHVVVVRDRGNQDRMAVEGSLDIDDA